MIALKSPTSFLSQILSNAGWNMTWLAYDTCWVSIYDIPAGLAYDIPAGLAYYMISGLLFATVSIKACDIGS